MAAEEKKAAIDALINKPLGPGKTTLLTWFYRLLSRAGITKKVLYEGKEASSIRYDKGVHTSFSARFKTLATRHGANTDLIEELMGHRNKTVNNNKAYLGPEDYAEEDVLREYRKFGVRIFESKDDAIQMVCDDTLRQMDRQFDNIGIKVESSKLIVLLGERKRQLDTHDSASSSAESDVKRFAREQRKYSRLTLGEIEQLPEPERSYAYLEALNSIFSRMRNARALGGS